MLPHFTPVGSNLLSCILHLQVDAQSNDGLTALGFAAAAGHSDIVTMLSQHRAKVAVSAYCVFVSQPKPEASSINRETTWGSQVLKKCCANV